jgi:hypothetical protein
MSTRDSIEDMFDPMTHHWRPSDLLEQSLQPGEWRMYDRGIHLGTIQYGRANGRAVLRGITPDGRLLGYAATLEEASDRLWEWSRRRRGSVRQPERPPHAS